MITLTLLALLASVQSQPPSPGPPIKREPPQQQPGSAQAQSTNDPRGTDQLPLTVKVLPTQKTEIETANERAQREDESAANWWMVRFTGVIVFMTLVQILVNGLQTKRLRETIEKMDEIDKRQAEDVARSIAEATRSAAAMEIVANSLAANVTQLETVMRINQRMADLQEAALCSANRAYLSIEETQFRNFGPGRLPSLILQIKNVGHTPATITAWASTFLTNERITPEHEPLMVWNPHSVVVFPDKMVTLESPASVDAGFTPDEWAGVLRGSFPIAAYGAIKYDAGFKIEGETGYGINYDPNNTLVETHRRFHSTDVPGYNYHR